MPRRPLSLALSLLALSLPVLASCGSSSSGNGVASKSAEEIVAEAKKAADEASSVHVSGSVNSGGSPVTLDLNLASEKGASGQISQNGSTFKVIIDGANAYISGSDAFYRKLGGAAAAQLLAGKWLKISTSTPEFASFGSLTNMRKLLDTVLVGHGSLEKGSTTTVAGQQAIAVKDTTRGGSLYVAANGKPYPLQITKGGSEAGTISFDKWDEPVSISAPASSVNLSELKSLASGH
ncbi:MAG TPA: hypothetical protein VFW38_11090 [Solirubrobacteraceae bacterium]|nr:hypothetical protein [Solirubrobacteraceae bacterium]